MSKKRRHRYKHRFRIVYKDCARGVHGRISVVKRKSDGKLLIWKRPRSHNHRHQISFQQEIKKSKLWRKFGVSKVRACWHPDNKSLIKTYIKGPTLKQMLRNGNLRFSKSDSKPVKALGEFIKLLIDSRHYIQDVNRQNLVFDGEKWHIIDSSGIQPKAAYSVVRQKYKQAFVRSWSKSLHSNDELYSFGSFLEKYCH